MNCNTWVQRRRGEIKANLIPQGQCGFKVGQKLFRYEAIIEVRELDENDYILDNGLLDKLFDQWAAGDWQGSCEDLAGGGVCAIIDATNQRAERIEVTVSPNENASLTCKWVRGEGRPKQCPRPVQIGQR